MPRPDLEYIKKVTEAATVPTSLGPNQRDRPKQQTPFILVDGGAFLIGTFSKLEDAEFFRMSRTAIPELLAYIKELEEENENLKSDLMEMNERD